MSGTSACESLTRNAKIPEIARKSGCGGIGIRARLRCVWHYVLASSSLAIRIEYMKQLLTVFAVSSCFVFDAWVVRNRVFARYFLTVRRFGKKPGFFDFDCEWRETGFLPQTLLQPADSGKNPVSSIVSEWPGISIKGEVDFRD
jgi:hypothetical protein